MGFPRQIWMLVVASLLALGCQSSHEAACDVLYEHLLEIGGAPSEPERRARFIASCEATWDEGRHRCMMRAATVDETLECRPTRVRPE